MVRTRNSLLTLQKMKESFRIATYGAETETVF